MTPELNNTEIMDVETKDGVKRVDFTAGRRAFLRSLGIGTAGAMTLGAANLTGTPAKAQQANLDVAILNFALNLEYLESEFYLRAYYGTGNADADIGGGTGTLGAVNGGHKVNFQEPLVRAYAQEIANEERKHVQFLRSALGAAKVNRPQIDLIGSFTTAARAAGLIGPKQQFDAFGSDLNFLLASYIFEDVGVTAYHGAAPLITNKTYLDAAAGILAVEAYHAGIIRTSLFAMGAAPRQATALISALRAKLDETEQNDNSPAVGKTIDDVGVGRPNMPTLVPVDANAIAFDRTTSQVLNIVYGNISATQNPPVSQPGLFFPAGLNGDIK